MVKDWKISTTGSPMRNIIYKILTSVYLNDYEWMGPVLYYLVSEINY